MCLAKAYFVNNDENELLMADVTSIKSEDGMLLVTSLFGDKKEIKASIEEIDFRGSKVTLKYTGA